jgi:hypothetical protein
MHLDRCHSEMRRYRQPLPNLVLLLSLVHRSVTLRWIRDGANSDLKAVDNVLRHCDPLPRGASRGH